jgi:hypothetical protein
MTTGNYRQQVAVNPGRVVDLNEGVGFAREEDLNLLLDRFGLALAGEASHSDHNDVDGMPYIVSDSQIRSVRLGPLFSTVRGALVGAYSAASHPTGRLIRATDIGAQIILLAQCVRETNLGVEYLEYSTLPNTNVSTLFTQRDTTWEGSGDSFTGDIKSTYDNVVASYPGVYDMFNPEDRQQFLEHPLIPYRVGTYIHAYMKYYYGK